MIYLKKHFNAKDSGLVFSLAIAIFLAASVFLQVVRDTASQINVSFNGDMFQYFSSLVLQLSFLLLAVIYCKNAGIDFFSATRIEKKVDKKSALFSAIIGLSMMLALIVPVLLFDELLKAVGYVTSSGGIKIDSLQDLILGTVCIAVLPAVCEEILFRGIILSGLRRFGDTFAVFVSAALFMLMHQNPDQTAYPFLSGLVIGFVYVKSGNLIYPIIIHFLNNFFNVLSDFIVNSNSIYYETVFWRLGIPDIIMIAAGILLFVFALRHFAKKKNSDLIFPPQPKIIAQDIALTYRTYQRIIPMVPGVQKAPPVFDPFTKPQEFDPFNLSGAPEPPPKEEETPATAYLYSPRKRAFFIPGAAEEDIPTPPFFKDVSKTSFYNPFFTSKYGFLLYSLFGIAVSVATWITVFLNL